MKNERFFELLVNIDDDLIERAQNSKQENKSKTTVFFKWASIAASFCLVFGLSLAVIIQIINNLSDDDPSIGVDPPSVDIGELPSDDTEPPTDNGPPKASTIVSSDKITGKQELVLGNIQSSSMADGDIYSSGFYIQTVVEANVIEVLPDLYYMPNSQKQYHIARLSVIDSIRGEGIPSEIYLRFPYYEADIFDGYDTFIFSLRQVGIENYMMINEGKKEVAYFSDMFEVYIVDDLGYGSVIAFNDGMVDDSFFKKATHFIKDGFKIFTGLDYPVTYESTVEEAKENVKKLAAEWEEGIFLSTVDCNYKTAKDVFVSEEAEKIKDCVLPNGTNVFMQEIHVRNDRVVATYTRIINGFVTDEKIVLNGYTGENGNVESDVTYSPDDLSSIPDIGKVLEKLDLSKLTPPHIEMTDSLEFRYCQANGYYRRVENEDKIYGIIRIVWNYRYGEDSAAISVMLDDCYYLYDNEGNGVLCERDELKKIIGNDSLILDFEYNEPIIADI